MIMSSFIVVACNFPDIVKKFAQGLANEIDIVNTKIPLNSFLTMSKNEKLS